MKDEECSKCKYFFDGMDCRRHPPTGDWDIVITAPGLEAFQVDAKIGQVLFIAHPGWPTVEPFDWCGEFVKGAA